MAKITMLLVAILTVAFVAVIFASVIGEYHREYTPGGYDSEQLAAFNKMSEVTLKAGELKNASSGVMGGSSDIELLKDTKNTLEIIGGSFNLYKEMTSSGIEKLGLGELAAPTSLYLTTLVIILVFVGIVVALFRIDA